MKGGQSSSPETSWFNKHQYIQAFVLSAQNYESFERICNG